MVLCLPSTPSLPSIHRPRKDEEKVVIMYRSLHILHVLLKHLLTFERESRGRENFLIEHLHSGSSIDDIFGYETRDRFCVDMDGTLPSCMTTGSSEECVRLEAVSIMNAILLRSDAYTEREQFGFNQVFESISQLLRKEAGLLVQKEAVHALYLLLNCPKLAVTFCSGCTMEASADAANDKENTTVIQVFTMILEGLGDCIACPGNSLRALELRKDAITLLAFVASSGKSGFEILVNNKLSREGNFLTLIIQLLASEVDLEATLHTQSDETDRARTLLIREMLILLNRLVSNPVQSATVLRSLTNSRDMASLTIDVSNRLSREEPKLRLPGSITNQMRDSEIVNLGRMFKRRISTYLGE